MYPHLQTEPVRCPYCGETIEVVLDLSVAAQTYVEDCAVCCRPITLTVESESTGEVSLIARHEDDAT